MVQKREGDTYTTKILEQTEKDEHEQKGVKQQAAGMSKNSSSTVTEKKYILWAQAQKQVGGKIMGKCRNSLLRAMRRQGVFEEKRENATEASECE